MKRYLSVVIAFSLFISVMCGCQKVPEQNAVISKNDIVFQEKLDMNFDYLFRSSYMPV